MAEDQARILVINAGSSSIKLRLYRLPGDRLEAYGLAERIGEAEGRLGLRWREGEDWAEQESARRFADHHQALEVLVQALIDTAVIESLADLEAAGHRVVHGGEVFSAPTRLDAAAVAAIERLSALAPLHNPPGVDGIRTLQGLAPELPQYAVFDTAFHHTLPPEAYLYALPRELHREHGVRRYGFHGTSHHYVAQRAAERMARPLQELRLITLHLGNGASVTAVQNGQSIDTSMGMTPTEGLVMGTRCGDLDPAIPLLLCTRLEKTPQQVEDLLNHQSGLKGLAGAGDMRALHEKEAAGDQHAALAIRLLCRRLKKYIGAYAALMGGLDAIVFTGGIGEHDAAIRAGACADLGFLGIELDQSRNRRKADGERAIHRDAAAVALWVIPTNEELAIARQVWACFSTA